MQYANKKKDKNAIVKWFEETVCEAMSMYILTLSASRWEQCMLHDINTGYKEALRNYCNDLYNNIEESVLRKCTSLAELRQIEMNCESNRLGRSIERNYLYDTFLSMPNDISTIIYYTQYIDINRLQIDFNGWSTRDFSKQRFLSQLESIQPAIGA